MPVVVFSGDADVVPPTADLAAATTTRLDTGYASIASWANGRSSCMTSRVPASRSSHSASLSAPRMTGMRSWMGRSRSFGSVVRMA